MTSLPLIDELRPRTFGDCLREGWGDGAPCPWVRCTHHLAWARALSGKDTVSAAPGDLALLDCVESLDLESLPETCAIRAAQRERLLGEIGELLGVSRERVRQLEERVFKRFDAGAVSTLLQAIHGEGHEVSRPDLAVGDEGPLLTTLDLRPALARIDPRHARAAEEASRRHGGNLRIAVEPMPWTGAPVRVLVGEERERRIAELKARAPSKSTHTKSREEPMTTPIQMTATIRGETKTRHEWAAVVGVTKNAVDAAVREKGGTFESEIERRLDAIAKRSERAALVESPSESVAVVAAKKPRPPRVEAASASVVSVEEIPRMVAVIARLGGLERAERLAEALQ